MLVPNPASPPRLSITKVAVFISVILAGIAVVFMLIQPKTTTPLAQSSLVWQNNFDGSSSEFSRVTFVGTKPEVPARLPVVFVSQSNKSLLTIAQRLVEIYQLKPVELNVWESDTYFLDASAGSVCLSLSRKESTTPAQALLQPSATQVATQLLDDIFGQSSLALIPSRTLFLRGQYQLIASPPSLADLIEHTFAPAVTGYPIMDSLTTNPTARIMLDSSNEVQKLELCPFAPAITIKSEHPTISVNEAVKNINRNQAVLLQAVGRDDPLVDTAAIESGTLDKVSIEYRTNPDGQEAVPYYRFVGQLTNGAGIKMSAEVLTLAILL